MSFGDRWAIISDIHGNLPALEAVLADIEAGGISVIYHLGDLVGYNPFPNECVALVRERGLAGITGNYDQAVLGTVANPVATFLNPQITSMGKEIYRWTAAEVDRGSREFLASLPERLTLRAGPWEMLLTHGSPRHIRDYIRPWTPEETLREIVAAVAENVIITGHTHIPLVRRVNGTWLLNPGSVGFPKDGNPWAAYAILTPGEELQVEIRRVPYDIEATAREILRRGLPAKAAEDLRVGRR